MTRARLGGLWRHPEFRLLWAGQAVSQLGSQFTLLALPLTAALTLGASPRAMGVLAAATTAPFLIVGLFAGASIDHRRRRPVLIAADLGRAALLLTVPVAAWLGVLSIWLLVVAASLVGTLTVFFDVAYQSYLPTLVGRERLIEGNSKLEVSRSAAEAAGPGIAGAVVQVMTAPAAILIDAASFVVSALTLGVIRTPEPAPAPRLPEQGVLAEIGEGLRQVFGHPLLRTTVLGTAIWNSFNGAMLAIFVLYATQVLRLGPALIGVIYACASIGFLLGALVAGPAVRRFGLGSAVVRALLLVAVGRMIVPVVTGPAALAVTFQIAAATLIGVGGAVYDINQISLQQAITPDHLQGRVNATLRFVVWGAATIGALVGGMLGEAIGLRPTLIVATMGGPLVFLWGLLSPLRALREHPVLPDRPPLGDEPSSATV